MVETVKPQLYSRYDDAIHAETAIAKGQHRNLVGGMWDGIGNLQFEFVKSNGLLPHHRFLDIGCGALRAGIKIIPYLEPNNYFGIDAEKRLLDAGYDKELKKAGIIDRLRRDNLFCSHIFRHDLIENSSIDFGICAAVVTHLPFNFIRVCLENTAPYFKVGGRLFVTYFELPEGKPYAQSFKNPVGITTNGFKDPYHYYKRDMKYAANGTPWRTGYIGDWKHPRGQQMIEYIKD